MEQMIVGVAPGYAMARPTLAWSKPDIAKLISEAVGNGESVPAGWLGLNKAQMLDLVLKLGLAHMERRFAARLARAGETIAVEDGAKAKLNSRSTASFQGLTATECNEWLATLPPMPFGGHKGW